MMIIWEIIYYFTVYSFLGWIGEIIYCGILSGKITNRGFLMGPVCPIYGVGAVSIYYSLSFLRAYPILIFLGGVILASSIEYLTSYALEKVFHLKWWDYSSYKFNIHGRVCLQNSLIFGIGALVVIYFAHPFLQTLYGYLSYPMQLIWGSVIVIVFLVDFVVTLFSLLSFKKVTNQENWEEKVKQMRQNYDKNPVSYWQKYIVEHFVESFPMVKKVD